MYRVSGIKLPIQHNKDDIKTAVAKTIKVETADIVMLKIIRRSIDARDKSNIFYAFTVDIKLSKEPKGLMKNKKVSIAPKASYEFNVTGNRIMDNPPVICGFGPAGMFCALFLARAGFKPVVLERGECVEKRLASVEEFWNGGELKPDSNVQFGEGGAGTFSDGKLNTMVKDKSGRNRVVLETFVKHGANEEITYVNNPHIGTDKLIHVVKSIREEIISLGGQVLFDTKLTGISIDRSEVTGVSVIQGGLEKKINTNCLVMACGHSARDTFKVLDDLNVPMEPKSFAVGLRVMHPQSMISESQYGKSYMNILPPADYKVTAKGPTGRGVYSFCMCPGGFVVNASSEEDRLAVNGMSYAARDSKCANSAIIVTVDPKDFGSDDVLSGVQFQRRLEEKAYNLCNGKVPVQLFQDFKENRKSKEFGEFQPEIKGEYDFGNLRELFDEDINETIIKGMTEFGRKIEGFARYDSIFAGVESRTSSPVRIIRQEDGQSEIKGLFPCGEGAGYAGGITSAAMDGIKVAEYIAKNFKP